MKIALSCRCERPTPVLRKKGAHCFKCGHEMHPKAPTPPRGRGGSHHRRRVGS